MADLVFCFSKLNLMTLEEFQDPDIDFFENGQSYSVILAKGLDKMTDEEVIETLSNFDKKDFVPCENEDQLKVAIKAYEQMDKFEQESVFFLVTENTESKIDIDTKYFFANLKTPRLEATSDYTDSEEFLNGIMDFKSNFPREIQLRRFVTNFCNIVSEEFQKICSEKKIQLCRTKGFNTWLLGNGIYLPDLLATLKGEEQKTIFEAAIFSNLVAANKLLMPSELKQLEGVSSKNLQDLVKYIYEVIELNPVIEDLRIGTLEEYELKLNGHHILMELHDSELEDLFSERDIEIYICKQENGKIHFDTMFKVYDTYNNGGVYDLQSLIAAIGRIADLSNVVCIAKIQK
ncbi:hypothetical protein R4575_17005 [Acinetobacter baumannii]|nr:hypothetical protein [Acinetobacter baumannii]